TWRTLPRRSQTVMPRSTPSEARKATDASRAESRQAPKRVGLGMRIQAARPATAVVKPRIGAYTHHFRRDSRRSQTFDTTPTAKPPSGPNATAEKTRGRNETDIEVLPVTPTP